LPGWNEPSRTSRFLYTMRTPSIGNLNRLLSDCSSYVPEDPLPPDGPPIPPTSANAPDSRGQYCEAMPHAIGAQAAFACRGDRRRSDIRQSHHVTIASGDPYTTYASHVLSPRSR